MKKVISVRFKENGKSYYFDPGDAVIHTGEYVIVETARGVECGEVVQGVRELADAAVPKALKPITRMADSVDIRRMRQNREDEKRAYHTCQECIARHGLEMKLVEAEYTLDRSKIMFYFTADGRVDFRELVKDLAGIFHTRIELRQRSSDVLPCLRGECLRVPEQHHAHGGQHGAHPGRSGHCAGGKSGIRLPAGALRHREPCPPVLQGGRVRVCERRQAPAPPSRPGR